VAITSRRRRGTVGSGSEELCGDDGDAVGALRSRVCASRRGSDGDREIDLIVERGAQLLAIEVKLSQVVND
jgi:hypothetical protein